MVEVKETDAQIIDNKVAEELNDDENAEYYDEEVAEIPKSPAKVEEKVVEPEVPNSVTITKNVPVVAAKKKFNRLDYMFANKTGEELTKLPGSVDGAPFNIRFLEDCTVNIFDQSAAINMDKCKNCTMFIGPVTSSIFIRDCENCVIHVACQQFRCRDFTDSTIYLYSMNDPVIEASSGLKFAPYNLMYAGLDQQAEKAGLNTDVNKWELVFDFSTTGQPNFT